MKMITTVFAALIAMVGSSANAAYVKYDITTYAFGVDTNYFTQISRSVNLFGTYSLVFDLSSAQQGADGSFSEFSAGTYLSANKNTNVFNLGSYTFVSELQGRRFNFILADGALNNGPLSNISISDVVSGQSYYPCCAHHQSESFNPGVVTSISTQFSENAFSSPLGLTIVREVIAPVPEPAIWTLMLLGFGGIGYAMRRNRVVRSPFSNRRLG